MSLPAVDRRAALHTLIGAVVFFFIVATTASSVTTASRAPLAVPTPPTVPTLAPASTSRPLATPSPTSLPPTPLPRALRVGIQAGHWLTSDVPDELAALRGTFGVWSADWDEEVVNQQVARQVSEILRREGIEVDVLPVTVPEHYAADLFLALHADASKDPEVSGFKVARSEWSQNPERDDALVQDLIDHYQAGTGLADHSDTISDNMTEYYAFNYEKYRHAVDPSTPAAIIEMGFLSNDRDRSLLTQEPSLAAASIARAVLQFLGKQSPTPPH